jgi:DNA-binding transcriptional regulator YhcF (GntR family)
MAQSPGDLDFSLDRGSDLPLGAQLGWRLRSHIASGRLGEGDRLPGVREMAGLAGVNVNTVRSVYGRLSDEGAISSEHGRGTFVADRAAAEAGLDRLGAFMGSDPLKTGAAAARRGEAQGFAAEARRRASLRAEIALLERELAALEVPATGEPAAEQPRRQAPTPQLLTAADLEAIRDELVERLAPLRADRTIARTQRERARHDVETEPAAPAPRQRAIATTPPKFETGAGGWSLRWSG